MEVTKYLEYVCSVAETIIKKEQKEHTQVIEAIAELEINGVEYQAQIILEPKKSNWTPIDKPTVRIVIN